MRIVAATPERDADLLRLLEENAMSGDVSLVMTRRPRYFSPEHDFGIERSALALEGERAVGMCRLTEHAGFANGKAQALGYLGGLRISPNYRHRVRVLQAGFDYLRQLSPPDYCYTSIATDNRTALRLLERGIPGLPAYRPLGEMCTLAISRKRGKRRGLWRMMPQESYADVVECYRRNARLRQLAPVLDAGWLHSSGATVLGYYDGQTLSACAALWNQQAFKQVLASRYSLRARLLRPFYNGYAMATGRVPLPKAGQALDQSFLAFFAADDGDMTTDLIMDALPLCPTRIMTLGLPAAEPSVKKLTARTRAAVYRTRLYGVDLSSSPEWDNRTVWPEVALL